MSGRGDEIVESVLADIGRIRFLTEAEAVQLVNSCSAEFRRLLRAALLTGARYGEPVRMTVGNFNAATAQIYVTPSKSGKARHSYASALAQAGADLLTISKLLGHADTRITSRHYAHLCDETLANAVNNLLPNFGETEATNVAAIGRERQCLLPTLSGRPGSRTPDVPLRFSGVLVPSNATGC